MNQKIFERFTNLIEEINALEASKTRSSGDFGDGWKIDSDAFLAWRVKAKNIILQVCGEKSQHFIEFTQSEKVSGLGDGYHSALKRTSGLGHYAYMDVSDRATQDVKAETSG